MQNVSSSVSPASQRLHSVSRWQWRHRDETVCLSVPVIGIYPFFQFVRKV